MGNDSPFFIYHISGAIIADIDGEHNVVEEGFLRHNVYHAYYLRPEDPAFPYGSSDDNAYLPCGFAD